MQVDIHSDDVPQTFCVASLQSPLTAFGNNPSAELVAYSVYKGAKQNGREF